MENVENKHDQNEQESCSHKDANGEWTVTIVDGQYELCTQCGLIGK